MTTLVDLLIEKKERQEKYFSNYLGYAKLLKREAEKNLGGVKVFLFGSILKGEARPGSDIDLLVVSPELKTAEQKSKTRVKILKKLGFLSPFELHLITPEEYQDWYGHFIKEKIEVK